MTKELEASIIKNKFEYEKIDQSIFLIYDVFSKNEIKNITNIIDNSTQKDWEFDYWQSQINLAERNFGRSDVENLIEEGLMDFTENWNDKSLSLDPLQHTKSMSKKVGNIFNFDKSLFFYGFDCIQRQPPGTKLTEHIDNNADERILYACIGYIDNNYNGGELYFSKINVEIKPPKNSILIFPGSERYSHGVKETGDGPTRYSLPTFVYRRD